MLVTAACLHAVLKPYRSNLKNNVDLMILILLEIVSLVFLTATYHPATATFTLYTVIAVLLIGIPPLVLIFYICYKFAKEAGITQFLKRKYRTLKTYPTRCTRQAETDVEAESDISSLPDRLINPEEYEPVVLTTEEHRAAQPTDSINESRRLTPVYTYGSFN